MTWQVVVWGGGTGGVAAALQSARCGASTLLLTPGIWLGGMVSAAGVSAPDGHEISCWQSGLWGALLRELEQTTEQGLDQNWVSCFGFRPEQAERILQTWVESESTLTWWSETELLEVSRQGHRVESLTVLHDNIRSQVKAEVLIDGSDLGECMAMADVPFRWGWEAREMWNEPSAPERHQLQNNPFFEQQPIQSPTWVVMGQLGDGAPPDHPVIAPIAPFEHCFETYGLRRTLTYGRLPGGLVMLNWPLHGNDWHQGLGRCISADAIQRQMLSREMQAHSRDFLHHLCASSDGWLQPGRVFPGEEPELALMPYWREGRRLIGRETVSEKDLLPIAPEAKRGPLPLDDKGHCTSIAVGTYANDHHYPGKDWPLAPKSCRWGGRWTGTPFCIPFGALFSDDATNLLLADKAFSVSHIANGATRLQPLILNIGQAAGMAAGLAIQRGLEPAELPVRDLQQALISDRQAPAAVMPIWSWPVWHHQWAEAQRRACFEPSGLDCDGCLDRGLTTDLLAPDAADTPIPPFIRAFQGRFRRMPDDSWQLETDQGRHPLITLEPAVQALISSCSSGACLALQACVNPWGPWLRVVRASLS